MKICFNKVVKICPARAECLYKPAEQCPEGLNYQEEEIPEMDYKDISKIEKFIKTEGIR